MKCRSLCLKCLKGFTLMRDFSPFGHCGNRGIKITFQNQVGQSFRMAYDILPFNSMPLVAKLWP